MISTHFRRSLRLFCYSAFAPMLTISFQNQVLRTQLAHHRLLSPSADFTPWTQTSIMGSIRLTHYLSLPSPTPTIPTATRSQNLFPLPRTETQGGTLRRRGPLPDFLRTFRPGRLLLPALSWPRRGRMPGPSLGCRRPLSEAAAGATRAVLRP